MAKNDKQYREIPEDFSPMEKFIVEEMRDLRDDVKEIRKDVVRFKIKVTTVFAFITASINAFFNYGGHK